MSKTPKEELKNLLTAWQRQVDAGKFTTAGQTRSRIRRICKDHGWPEPETLADLNRIQIAEPDPIPTLDLEPDTAANMRLVEENRALKDKVEELYRENRRLFDQAHREAQDRIQELEHHLSISIQNTTAWARMMQDALGTPGASWPEIAEGIADLRVHREVLEAAKLRDGEDVQVWVELDDGSKIDFTANTAYIQRNIGSTYHVGVVRRLKAVAIGWNDKQAPVDIDIRIDGNVRIDNRILADLIKGVVPHA